MNKNRKIKIGIDVGGTFTHAVAVDISDYSIVGKSCVPTTHKSKEGVARGVVDSMLTLVKECEIHPEEVILIAHSTTQATNALLEGDVATVGVIGMAKGFEALLAKKECNPTNIELSPGKLLNAKFRFIDCGTKNWRDSVPQMIDELVQEGAQVIVATEAFGVDDPANEDFVAETASKKGILTTTASGITKLYGLRVRTRTAVINASMMPKMLETADMTEKAVRESGINAPLMVMRSDGGIMDINEMRKRPILTMLSGPAAGVAAALKYVKISDGIFLEVGGTSTDISVIKNGKPQVKTAQIGKNRLFVRTLDVRTLGIAGGSVPRYSNGHFIDVGPRSAHIAGLHYAAYSKNVDFSQGQIEPVTPLKGDPGDYLSIKLPSEETSYTLTPTECSYFLGLVSDFGHGAANSDAIAKILERLENLTHISAKEMAKQILTISAEKVKPVIKQLSREYKLDEALIEFVGGGGGASAIVPFTANYMNLPHKIAENSEVISAIGAALGIIRDSVERNIINPSENDILSIRQEAFESVVKMGANPDSVEVTIEIDNQNKKVIATALGSGELRTKDLGITTLDFAGIHKTASNAFRLPENKIEFKGDTGSLFVFSAEHQKSKLFGLFKEKGTGVKVIDDEGTVKLQINGAKAYAVSAEGVKSKISSIIAEMTTYGDAGALIPGIYLIAGPKIIDLSGLISETQLVSIAEIEIKNLPADSKCVIIAEEKK
ncbi:MAG: hydantoinase [Bacteroidetes bacterium]|nr:hydantoinase [Bacteroidota bacterium]